MALFAIKDAVDLTLTEVGGSAATTTIDFLNECQLQIEADQLYATKKGLGL